MGTRVMAGMLVGQKGGAASQKLKRVVLRVSSQKRRRSSRRRRRRSGRKKRRRAVLRKLKRKRLRKKWRKMLDMKPMGVRRTSRRRRNRGQRAEQGVRRMRRMRLTMGMSLRRRRRIRSPGSSDSGRERRPSQIYTKMEVEEKYLQCQSYQCHYQLQTGSLAVGLGRQHLHSTVMRDRR